MTAEGLSKADVGKRVENVDGTAVGRLVAVEDGRGFVDPNPSLVDTLKLKVGLLPSPDGAHPLDEGSIEAITDEVVTLRGTL